MSGPWVSDEDFAVIWEGADNCPEVARLTGYSEGYVRWRACRMRKQGWDLKFKSTGPINPPWMPTEEFIARWEASESLGDVALQCGRKRGSVSGTAGHLRRDGVPLKKFSRWGSRARRK